MTHEVDPGALHVDSYLVSAGRPPRAPGAPVNVPVEFTSTYAADGEVGYARFGNATWTAFETALGGLEGGQALVPEADLAVSRSTAALFSEKFDTAETTSRVDRIVSARSRELRSNRYALWGVR